MYLISAAKYRPHRPHGPQGAYRAYIQYSTRWISLTVTNRGRVAIDRYLKYRPQIKRV
jgi:hypothetical protein